VFQRGPKVRQERAILRETEDASSVLVDPKVAMEARLKPLFKPVKKRVRAGISHVTEGDNNNDNDDDDDNGDDGHRRKSHQQHEREPRQRQRHDDNETEETVSPFVLFEFI
jgi:hypothetical protein